MTYLKTVQPLANYNYIDIASGEGIVTFQGFASTDSAGTTYHLSANPIKSKGASTSHVKNSSSETFTYTFDASAFNLPRTLKGTAAVSFQFGVHGASVGDAVSRITITIQHWDGTTATDIGTKISETITQSAAAWMANDAILLIDLTEKHFAAGETLRIKVEHYCSSSGVSNKDFYFSHDPLNAASSASATAQSQFKINFPFKLDT